MDFRIRGRRIAICLTFCLAEAVSSSGQVTQSLPDAPAPQFSEGQYAKGDETSRGPQSAAEPGIDRQESLTDRLRDVPRRVLLGSAVPREKALYSLNGDERLQVYLKQTYFSPGGYFERALGAGYDQARGAPSEWGGGMEGYGRRFASRYGQFVIRNTLKSAGDAVLGYEPRYDLCRCDGFWNRTKHAIIRNLLTYNLTERELRPQLPYFGASFVAGMAATTWKPGHHNVLADGSVALAEQMGWGAFRNWLIEFSGDVGKKLSKKR